MFAQCPECMTVFAVDANTLARAHGCAGCSRCGATFDCIATLCDALPGEPFETLPVNEPDAAPPLLLQPIEHEHPPQQGLFQQAAVSTDDDALQPAPDGAATAGAAEELAPFRTRRRRKSTRPRALLAACIALAVVLLVQLAWAERAQLVKSPLAASWMRAACGVLGCHLPMARDLDQLELTSREVRRHPSVAGALLISATVHNQAAFRQPWPVISIKLSNLDNQPVAMRRFRPAEYLHDPAARRQGLPPDASVALVFEVLDPGQNAIAFQFGFM